MKEFEIRFLPVDVTVKVPEGISLLEARIRAGLHPDAPCGGKGTCGKCRVKVDGTEVLACKTLAERDMTVTLPEEGIAEILTSGKNVSLKADGTDRYALAFDIGTTTVAGWLLDGKTGAVLARAGTLNPQRKYGADVITRLQLAVKGDGDLTACIRSCLRDLTETLCREAGIEPGEITASTIAGNTAMHHLLLGIDPKPLLTPPYMPLSRDAMELHGCRILPNIAGFVGGDTAACMVAAEFDSLKELTLLLDIGTNGEMVLTDGKRRIACSTAAGPAFEGAGISCGMRGETGAVDHVWLEHGKVCFHVIGEGTPRGLCGSGLLDLIAVLLEQGLISSTGRLAEKTYTLAENVALTRKDVRQVQLAKAAIRAGIELLCREMNICPSDIQKVLLAGAFGSFMDPASACRIGMIPPELENRILPIGNAAGEGARRCALSREEFEKSKILAAETEFLELGGVAAFQQMYLDCLNF